MAQTNVNVRMDEHLKRDMEILCQKLGMNLTTAVTVFFRKAVMEQAIPFRVSAAPFYAEDDQARLREAIARLDAGRGTAHEQIEEDK